MSRMHTNYHGPIRRRLELSNYEIKVNDKSRNDVQVFSPLNRSPEVRVFSPICISNLNHTMPVKKEGVYVPEASHAFQVQKLSSPRSLFRFPVPFIPSQQFLLCTSMNGTLYLFCVTWK